VWPGASHKKVGVPQSFLTFRLTPSSGSVIMVFMSDKQPFIPKSSVTGGFNTAPLAMTKADYDQFVEDHGRTPGDMHWSISTDRMPARKADK